MKTLSLVHCQAWFSALHPWRAKSFQLEAKISGFVIPSAVHLVETTKLVIKKLLKAFFPRTGVSMVCKSAQPSSNTKKTKSETGKCNIGTTTVSEAIRYSPRSLCVFIFASQRARSSKLSSRNSRSDLFAKSSTECKFRGNLCTRAATERRARMFAAKHTDAHHDDGWLRGYFGSIVICPGVWLVVRSSRGQSQSSNIPKASKYENRSFPAPVTALKCTETSFWGFLTVFI